MPTLRITAPEHQRALWRNSTADMGLILPGPRLVKVHYGVRIGKFYTTTPSPANLLACKKSRWKMLDDWQLRFSTRSHPLLIRVDLAIDTVQLDWNPLRLQGVNHADSSSILSLELGEETFNKPMQKQYLSVNSP
jgi:hypothetical protein